MLFTRTRCLPRDPGPRIMTRVKKTTPSHQPDPPPQPPRVAVEERGSRNVFYWLAIFIWAATGRPLQVDFFKTPAARFKNVTNCPPPPSSRTLQIGVAGHRERRGQRRDRELWTLTSLGRARAHVKRQFTFRSSTFYKTILQGTAVLMVRLIMLKRIVCIAIRILLSSLFNLKS